SADRVVERYTRVECGSDRAHHLRVERVVGPVAVLSVPVLSVAAVLGTIEMQADGEVPLPRGAQRFQQLSECTAARLPVTRRPPGRAEARCFVRWTGFRGRCLRLSLVLPRRIQAQSSG